MRFAGVATRDRRGQVGGVRSRNVPCAAAFGAVATASSRWRMGYEMPGAAARSWLRTRDEQIHSEQRRQIARHQLTLDAVADNVERRRERAETALPWGDGNDA